jgi:hypothetical protein
VKIDGIHWSFYRTAWVLKSGQRLVEDFGVYRSGPITQVAPVVEAYTENFGGFARVEELNGINGVDQAGGSWWVEETAGEFVNLAVRKKAICDALVRIKSYK